MLGKVEQELDLLRTQEGFRKIPSNFTEYFNISRELDSWRRGDGDKKMNKLDSYITNNGIIAEVNCGPP